MRWGRLSTCFVIAAAAVYGKEGGSDDPLEILRLARERVAAHITQNANYACMETVDRTYSRDKEPGSGGCGNSSKDADRTIFMRDRLHLDVAVSEGNEIFAWHGQNQFSSSLIGNVVKSGPISSGNFIGFLHNVFLHPGVQIEYTGSAEIKGVETYRFHYVVPLASSDYHVQARHGNPIVAFHGSFTVRAPDYELTSLRVIADAIPSDSDICSADTEVNYQIVTISGKVSLIPSAFVLRLDQDSHIYTFSRSEYSGCREFRGESTLRFDTSTTSATAPAIDPRIPERWLPAGLVMRVELKTPVSDKSSYTGDAVDGVLLDPIPVPGSGEKIPKGAILHGVITELEFRYEPWKHYLVRIEFERVTFGSNSLRLRAVPRSSKKSAQALWDVYGYPLPPYARAEYDAGIFAFASSHFHVDPHFIAEWRTTERPSEMTEPRAPSAHPQ